MTPTSQAVESFAAYRARVLGYLGGRDPIRILTRTPARLDVVISARSRGVLHRHPAPGKWSAAEIVAHLADAEIAFGWRVRTMLADRSARLPAFDQDRWVTVGRCAGLDPRGALKLFRVLRRSNLALLRCVPRRAWQACVGVHEIRGRHTLGELVQLEAGHDLNHLGQLTRLVGPLPRRPR